jgi:putative ABC transport system permease protein
MKQLFNQCISIIQIAILRTWASLAMHSAIMLGVLAATTTICALILYAEAINVVVLRDRLARAHAEATFDLLIKGESNLIDARRYQAMDSLIRRQMSSRVGLPITQLGRHGWSKSLTIVPPGESPIGRRSQLPRTRFQFYADIAEQIEIVDGQFPRIAAGPQDMVEVMVTEKLAQELGLSAGEVFTVEDFTGGAQPMRVTARLAAVIRLRDPDSNFWFYAPWFLDEALTVPEETFFQAIALAFVPTEAEVTWAANYDETTIGITNVGRVIAGLDSLRFNLTGQLERLQFLTDLDNVLREYRRSTFLLEALLVVLGAPVIGIALYYITMSSQLLVEHQRGEIAVLKSRGSSIAQVLLLFFAQGLLMVLLATLLAPLLAAPLAQLIGSATTFMVFDNLKFLPVALRPAIYGYAALAAALALAAILSPTFNASQATIVTYRRESARDNRQSFIHRTYLDIILLLAGGWGYRTLNQSGTIITRNETGGLEFDPLLLLTPMALVLGLALLALRFTPLAVRGLAEMAAQSDRISLLFALRQVARAPARYNGLILILTFTLALGLFTATVAGAFDRNYSDQAMYAAGADARVHEFDFETVSWRVQSLETYRAIPGVEAVTPAHRVNLVGRRAQILAKGTLLAIDPATFGAVAWWRADFTPSLDRLLRQLGHYENAILADERFVQRHRLEVGETFDIDVDGKRVDFVLAGAIDYFPTLYPASGDRLITRLDYLTNLLAVEPSEVWLKTQPRQHRQVIAALYQNPTGKVIIEDGHQLAGVRKEDPLRTGLFGALSLGFIAASVLSIIGFLLYAYVSIQARALQFGVLRATGLSVGQLIRAIAFEQLLLIGIGVLLGTGLGGGAGWLFTRFLQVSIIAREAVPPFLVETPWSSIISLYLILVIVFGVALVASVYLLRRMRVQAILRLGEQ